MLQLLDQWRASLLLVDLVVQGRPTLFEINSALFSTLKDMYLGRMKWCNVTIVLPYWLYFNNLIDIRFDHFLDILFLLSS